MTEHLPVADQMIAPVHRHEAGELEEAWIDLPPAARIIKGHGRDHILLEPAERPLGGDGVDRGRRFARVDRAAHHGERARPRRILVGRHQAGGGEGGHRRLAHRQHVRAGADMLEEGDQIVDIIVEVELALGQRHQPRIGPVGDPHVVAGQHPLDRAAQQGGIMARHRRHDEQLGLAFGRAGAGEVDQPAERLGRLDHLFDRHFLAVDDGEGQIESGFAVRRCGMGEDIEPRCHHVADAGHGKGVGRIAHPFGAESGPRTRAGQQAPLHLIGFVQH